MKKIFFTAIFLCMTQSSEAQYNPSFDEILDLAMIKDSAAFRKTMESKGLRFVRMKILKELNGYFIEYLDTIKCENGYCNKLTWIVYHKQNAPDVKYADFTTTNFEKIKSLEKTLDDRKFDKVDLRHRKDERNNLVTAFFYKKGNTGVQTTFSTMYLKTRQVPMFSFSVTIPASASWPKDM